MEDYYYLLKNVYKIEPKFNFKDEIINNITVYNYKCSCLYNGITFTTEISTENDILKDSIYENRIVYNSMAILLLSQLNNKIQDYTEKI